MSAKVDVLPAQALILLPSQSGVERNRVRNGVVGRERAEEPLGFLDRGDPSARLLVSRRQLDDTDRVARHQTARRPGGPPVEKQDPFRTRLDAKIEGVELSLRRLIADRVDGDRALLPPHVQQRVHDRVATAARKLPDGSERRLATLEGQLEYFDLREVRQPLKEMRDTWRMPEVSSFVPPDPSNAALEPNEPES